MTLSHSEQSRLSRIEASLRRSDPKLAGMLGMFGRLCAGQRMPAWEQAPSRLGQIRQAAALLAAAAAVAAAARLMLAAARALAAIVHGGRAWPPAPKTGRPGRSRERGGRPDLAGWG